MSKQRAKRCVWKKGVDPCGHGGRHMTRRDMLRQGRRHRRYWAGRHDWATLAVEMAAGCPF